MPKGGPEIAGSQEVRNLLRQGNKPEQLARTLAQHRQALTNGVEQGKRTLAAAYKKLTSEHARSFLSEKASSIGNTLRSIASKGYEIIQKHRRKKEDEEAPEISNYEYQSVNYLSQRLKTELSVLRNEIPNFQKLQDSKDAYKKAEEENTNFENEAGLKSFDDLVSHYQSQKGKLEDCRGLLPSSIDHSGGENDRQAFEEKITKRIEKYRETIEKYQESQKTFEANKKKFEEKKEVMPLLNNVITALEDDPTPERKSQLEELKKEMDLEPLTKEIFGQTMHLEEGQRVSDLYQDFWSKDYREMQTGIEELQKRAESAEKLVPIRQSIDENVAEGELRLSVVTALEMQLRSSPLMVDRNEYRAAIDRATESYTTARKLLVNTPTLPSNYSGEKTATVNSALQQLINSKSTLLQREQLEQENSDKIMVVETGSPELGNASSRIVFTEKGKSLPKEEREKLALELYGIRIEVEEDVEAASCHKAAENFWLGQALYEEGNLEGTKAALRQFLDTDINHPIFHGTGELEPKREIYKKRAEKMLQEIEMTSDKHKEFFEGQELIQKGDIIGAKKLLKAYLAKVDKGKESQGFIKSAKALLQKIALLQVGQVREKLKIAQRKGHIVWCVRFEKILNELETSIKKGQFLDFSDAYKHFREKHSELRGINEFNFLEDEIMLDEGKGGLLKLARKYRENGQYEMARQMFMQYFAKKLADVAKKHLSYETFRKRMDSNPTFHAKLSEKVEEAKKEYDNRAKQAGPKWVETHPWDEGKVRNAIQQGLYRQALPEETRNMTQDLSRLDPNLFNSEERQIWSEFANMEGIHWRGTWKEPFALSDERLDRLMKELPVELAIIALSAGIAGAAAGVARGAVMRAGLRGAAKVAVEHGVISTGRRLAVYGAGVLTNTTVFTASNVTLRALAQGDMNVVDNFQEEWTSNLVNFGVLGAVGQVAHALKLGTVSEFALEQAAEATLSGQYTMEDALSELAFSGGHKLGSLARVKRRTTETSPRALDTHYLSEFSSDLPGRQGELGTDLKIRYNKDYLQSFLPEGHTIEVKGRRPYITKPDGTSMPLERFCAGKDASPEGKRVWEAMRQIKTHEEVHRLFGLKVTPETMAELMEYFATPDADGKVPEGKVAMTDQDGRPVEVNQKNVEEFLAYTADGQLKISPEHRRQFESVLGKDIPDFSFRKARQIATKELANARREQLKRAEAMARGVQPAHDTDIENADTDPYGSEANANTLPNKVASGIAGIRTFAPPPKPTRMDRAKNTVKGVISWFSNVLTPIRNKLLYEQTLKNAKDPKKSYIEFLAHLKSINEARKEANEIRRERGDYSMMIEVSNEPLTSKKLRKSAKKAKPELYKIAIAFEKVYPEAAKRAQEQFSRDSIKYANKEFAKGTLTKALELIRKKDIILTEELFNSILLSKDSETIKGLEEILKTKNDLNIDWRLESAEIALEKMQKVLARIKEAEAAHNKIDEIHQIIFMTIVERVEKGEIGNEGSPLEMALKRLKEDDPEVFELVKNTELETLRASECFEAILLGQKLELEGKNGPVTVYVGKRMLGQGGFGRVDEVLYFKPGSKELTRGAYKQAHFGVREYLNKEAKTAEEIREWNHPNLIKALETGDGFIIYETGSNAKDMGEGRKQMRGSQWFSAMNKALNGLEELWRRKRFHGDFKPQNVLTYGKNEVKVIDLTPIEFKNSQNVDWPRTNGYHFSKGEIDRAKNELEKENKSPEEINEWLGRAQDVKAFGESLDVGLTAYLSKIYSRNPSMLPPSQKNFVIKTKSLIAKTKNPVEAGDPAIIRELHMTLEHLNQELQRVETDPTSQFEGFADTVPGDTVSLSGGATGA